MSTGFFFSWRGLNYLSPFLTAAAMRPLRLLLLLAILAQAADFTYTTNNGEITITGYTGAQAEVVIPDEIFGLSVTRVEARSYRLRSP